MILLAAQTKNNPESAQDAKKAIYNRLLQFDKAIVDKDLGKAMEIYDWEFVILSPTGKRRDFEIHRSKIREMMEALIRIKSTYKITAFSIAGNTATVVVHNHSDSIRNLNGTQRRMITTSSARQFWILKDKVWYMKQARALSSHATIDGKPVKLK